MVLTLLPRFIFKPTAADLYQLGALFYFQWAYEALWESSDAPAGCQHEVTLPLASVTFQFLIKIHSQDIYVEGI